MQRHLHITIIIGAVVAACIAIMAIDVLAGGLVRTTLFLVVVIVSVIGVGTAITRDNRLPLLCDPFFLSCVFLSQFFVIGSLNWHFSGGVTDALFAYQIEPKRVIQVLVAFILLLLMGVVGYRLRLAEVVASALPRFAPSSRKLPGRWIVAGYLGASLIGCLYWVSYQGGLMTRLSAGYGNVRPGGAMFRIAFVTLQVGTVLAVWLVISTRRRDWRAWVSLAVLIAFQAIFLGVLVGARKYVLFMFFALITVWLLRNGRKSLPRVRVAMTLAVLLTFFSVWGAVRGRPITVLMGQDSGAHYNAQRGMAHGFLSGTAGPFSVACLVWELFPEVEPYRHGTTLKVALFGFIPRAIWPDKPVGIGKEITRYLVGPFYEPTHGYSVTPTLLGDLYLNFGWIGVVLGGLLLGLVCRVVTLYAVTEMRDGIQTDAARVLIPAVFIMGLGEMRSDMATMFTTYVLSFVPLLLALSFFRFDARPQPERAMVDPRATPGFSRLRSHPPLASNR